MKGVLGLYIAIPVVRATNNYFEGIIIIYYAGTLGEADCCLRILPILHVVILHQSGSVYMYYRFNIHFIFKYVAFNS